MNSILYTNANGQLVADGKTPTAFVPLVVSKPKTSAGLGGSAVVGGVLDKIDQVKDLAVKADQVRKNGQRPCGISRANSIKQVQETTFTTDENDQE